MASSYPGALDSLTNPVGTDALTSPAHASQHANANDAIEAIEATLGVNPQGAYATVKDRLAVVDLAAGSAAASASAAAVSATSAAGAAVDAGAAANSAVTALDNFDDRYLGAKSSAPTVDNDGNALLTGALYWNSTSSQMFAYTGTAWTTLANVAQAIEANSSSAALRITQTGAGNALLVEDSANPDSTPFVIGPNGQVTTGPGSATDPAIAFTNDTNTGVFSPTADQIALATAGTARVVVDGSGRVLVGRTASESIAIETALQIGGTGADAYATIARYAANAANPGIIFGKSRGATVGTHGAVSSGDNIGEIAYYASDGTAWVQAAGIRASIDATPGTNDMPGRLVFSTTADGASSPTERMRITSAGNVGIGTSSPVTRFHSIGTASGATVATSGTTDSTMVARHQGGSVGIDAGVLSSGTSYLQVRNVNDLSVGYPLLLNPVAGNVGIGTSSPASKLHVYDASTSTFEVSGDGNVTLNLRRASTNNSPVSTDIYKSRGTVSSPTVVADGDIIGQWQFKAYDGSAYRDAALMRVTVDGAPGASDMPGRFGFWTAADGGTTLTERMRIDNAGLITGTGTSLGAWTAYTPTLGGTGWAIGNGTVTGRYCQIGKIVHFTGSVTFGSTSTFGGSALTISLPVTRVAATGSPIAVRLRDDSAAKAYLGTAVLTTGATTFSPESQIASTTGELSSLISTIPFTWATSDSILFSGTYEIA